MGWDPANYPAIGPKECVAVRTLKGKAERIIKHGVHSGGLSKKRCQVGSAEDHVQDLLDGFFVEAVQNPFVRLPVQGVYKRSPQRISVRDLTVQALHIIYI